MCYKTPWYYAKCAHFTHKNNNSIIGCPQALTSGRLCGPKDQTVLPLPLSGLCKRCKTQAQLKETVYRLMGIIRWKAGDSEGAMKAAMPPPETDEDNSDNQSFDEDYESNSESEYQFKLGTEFESDADAHASDAVGPRTSRSPTRKDPEGRCHLLHRWLDQADPYPQRHSSSSSFPSTSSAYTTNTGIMETETFFKAPILWKDERDQLGLRPLILVQKHDKLPHRRTICAGPGGLQPLILVEKYKKSWSWSSWNPNGSEKAEESPKLKPSVIHYVKELSMTAASTRSRLPVPAGRVSVRLGLLV